MAATCAVCLLPIVRRDGFLIHHTEVVHRGCVRGLASTKAVKLEAAVARLTEEVRGNERTLALYQEERGRLYEQIAGLKRDVREAGDAKRRAEAAAGTLDDRVRQERDAALTARDQAIRERDAARREAQLHQTIQGAPAKATPAAPVADPAPAQDQNEDSAARFSLLELDLPE